MLLSTQGLVLHTTKYAESSIVAKIFTRELGLCSYIIKGVRNKNGRNKQNLLQPLSHLDMTVYNNPKKQLQYIKEMHPSAQYGTLHTDAVKMALVFFMDEVLYKSLKEAEPNQPLFDYAVERLAQLNSSDGAASFPIDFLIHTARHLGIAPLDNYSRREPLFNLKEGRFLASPSVVSSQTSDADYFLDTLSSTNFHYCLSCSLSNTPMSQLSSSQRNSTLNNLLEYYHVHLSDFHNFTSHEILHAVLR